MIKELPLVDFETAKLLFEKGFNWPTNHWRAARDGALYNGQISKPHSVEDWNHKDGVIGVRYNCPTVSLAIRWLREVKGVFIDAIPFRDFSEWNYGIVTTESFYKDDLTYPTYDQAEAAALSHALKLIP